VLVVVAAMLLVATKKESYADILTFLFFTGRASVRKNAPLLGASCHEIYSSGMASASAAAGATGNAAASSTAAPAAMSDDDAKSVDVVDFDDLDDIFADMETTLQQEHASVAADSRQRRTAVRRKARLSTMPQSSPRGSPSAAVVDPGGAPTAGIAAGTGRGGAQKAMPAKRPHNRPPPRATAESTGHVSFTPLALTGGQAASAQHPIRGGHASSKHTVGAMGLVWSGVCPTGDKSGLRLTPQHVACNGDGGVLVGSGFGAGAAANAGAVSGAPMELLPGTDVPVTASVVPSYSHVPPHGPSCRFASFAALHRAAHERVASDMAASLGMASDLMAVRFPPVPSPSEQPAGSLAPLSLRLIHFHDAPAPSGP